MSSEAAVQGWGVFCKYAVDLQGVPLPRHGFMELRSGFIGIMLRRGCSSVGMLCTFRVPSPESTSGKLLLSVSVFSREGVSHIALPN